MKKSPLLMSILTVLLVGLFVVNTATSSPATVVGTEPLPSTAPVGTTFNLSIAINDVLNLYSWEFNMTFSATILRVENVVEGPFLQSAGTTMPPTPVIDNEHGFVFAGDALFPYPDHGADGNGVLAIITFSVKMKGKSDLHFVDTKLRTWDPINWVLVDIPHTAKDGFFQYPLGDVNSDGKVDASDLSDLSKAYGSHGPNYPNPGNPASSNWNANCDFNKDNKINASDLFDLCKNYGKS